MKRYRLKVQRALDGYGLCCSVKQCVLLSQRRRREPQEPADFFLTQAADQSADLPGAPGGDGPTAKVI